MTARHIGEPQTIVEYLRALDPALRGPCDWRGRVLAEVEDGLRCEAEALGSESAAIEAWGPVSLVAAGFAESGQVFRARRLAKHVLVRLPLLIVGWALVVALSPDPWPQEPAVVHWVAPVLFAATAAAFIGALQLIRRGGPTNAGVVSACVGVGVGVVCVAVLLVNRIEAAGGHLFWPAAVASAALTVTLVVGVATHARHLLRRA
ncbi:hypothetical protein V5P93_005722 [Actinokineospora auranticolor]|uniref:Uncharacterized protein n=1 Tax=Actinokineospora auranticolor TaxID=155976 RepID=A0A2S6GF51_9PSEU|nr:hypothetical protein [Actinokineospora auranticolor]PPK63849.1 hypothetical protein CLV40_12493 [Actinokineospora auranticolor]